MVIGIINTLLSSAARPLASVHSSHIAATFFVKIFYIYLYCLWGAYMRAIVLNYSNFLNSWVVTALCLASILIEMKYINQEASNERSKRNQMEVYDFESQKLLFQKSITVVCLSLSPWILGSFVVFFFTENLYKTAFFKLSASAAKWFM